VAATVVASKAVTVAVSGMGAVVEAAAEAVAAQPEAVEVATGAAAQVAPAAVARRVEQKVEVATEMEVVADLRVGKGEVWAEGKAQPAGVEGLEAVETAWVVGAGLQSDS